MLGERWKFFLPFLTIGVLLSCSNSPTKQPVSQSHEDGTVAPEIVRSEAVRIEDGVKMLTVSNLQGNYLLSCNSDLDSCITPAPGKDYLLFTKSTRWKLPGAEDFLTLAFIQGWSISYNNGENIALLPEHPRGGPKEFGMYWLRSWNKNKQN
jgi:hypothetical protein